MKIIVGRDDLAAAAREAIDGTGAQVERVAVKPVHKASAGFVNDGSVDLCELAIVTLLQAVAAGKPVLLLPVVTLARAQHQTLVTLDPSLGPAEVEGRTVGVRSWSQTTGVWVRGFLSRQYGVNLRNVDWITYEGAHVDGFQDPVWVRRAPAGVKLPDDFLAGTVDFAVLGNELPTDDRIRTAIPDAGEAGARWAKEQGFVPVNHVIGVSGPAARRYPEAICATYDAMAALDPSAAGFDHLRAPVSLAARFAQEQGVLTRPVEFDDLVQQTCSALEVDPKRLGG
jgi:4,5-dihydroxyphthalate decarboxylase